MNGLNWVEVMDRDGWRKEFPLSKQLIHIGSDAHNDVVLDTSRGGGVATRHLQLIATPGGQPGYRAINLGDTDVALAAGGRPLSPRSAMEVGDGDCLRLGDFSLTFRLQGGAGTGAAPASRLQAVATPPRGPEPIQRVAAPALRGAGLVAAGESQSAVIGLRLVLSQMVLAPDCPIDGSIAVRNLGSEPGVQFRLEMEGLDPDCYEIGPGPILFPGVEKAVGLRIYHPRRASPRAGRHAIQIRASAPDVYPGQGVTVTSEIDIQPFYSHSLRLVEPT